MLVLSRKRKEKIVINNDITIEVVEVRGDKVRLGIVAPKEVPIHRFEVWEAIRKCSSGSESTASGGSTEPSGQADQESTG